LFRSLNFQLSPILWLKFPVGSDFHCPIKLRLPLVLKAKFLGWNPFYRVLKCFEILLQMSPDDRFSTILRIFFWRVLQPKHLEKSLNRRPEKRSSRCRVHPSRFLSLCPFYVARPPQSCVLPVFWRSNLLWKKLPSHGFFLLHFRRSKRFRFYRFRDLIRSECP